MLGEFLSGVFGCFVEVEIKLKIFYLQIVFNFIVTHKCKLKFDAATQTTLNVTNIESNYFKS